MVDLDETHEPAAQSWVESANRADGDFPIQNLPFCVFRRGGETSATGIGVGIGELVLDLGAAARGGLLQSLDEAVVAACAAATLNDLMALGPPSWRSLRRHLFRLLEKSSDRRAQTETDEFLVPQKSVAFSVPAAIGDYTDFSASLHHGRRTREARGRAEQNPELKFYLPAAYHGRSSSIVVSGSPVVRPKGLIASDGDEPLGYAPCKDLDFELEFAFYVGPGNELGRAVPIDDAEGHIFGCSLLNDWSARDIQLWEGPRLGPYLSKSFTTTVSPWVVTLDALAPFRTRRHAFDGNEPIAPGYLRSERDRSYGALNIGFEAAMSSERMRRAGTAPAVVCRSSLLDVYWSIFQLLAHQSSNGCNLRSGDLIATGTVSGPEASSAGCLLESARGEGKNVAISSDEARRFLEDGDEVIFRARAEAQGRRAIGFGECRGIVLAAN